MIYTLDTSVLVDALRQPTELEYLKEFLNWALPQTALSSVVASELLAGARTAAARRLVDGEFLGAFARRGRIVAPSTAAWVKTGISLGQSGGGSSGVLSQNDLLLAHTARELGWSIITRDKDFARIRHQVKGLRVESPYPRQTS
jgi:predicted nucleic acid-binding protein